ncbi:LysM peptidoglycan-binding domain-containing protein [Demequina sp. SYSU T00192]|uniref:LysM peptidoglycan-binding domain-containing protein n=1 Tax=Demequina litoralis TaxID=3051660 RepID=A0ABT8GB24_9MICO|nr:LysM peptidoglycan-binding domain-containing protein [Demequina sp. SYSU T00192]MDN4476167.1 LysM peptidoglycan-binding domain-containing protein [Demequina sp. SYSU T00192]
MSIYAPQTPEARARRTRTGRILAVLLLLVGAAVIGPQAFASDGAGEPVAVDVYTVGTGETLWDIASSMTPAGDDVRDTMVDIQHLNAMTDTALMAGEQIYLPVA